MSYLTPWLLCLLYCFQCLSPLSCSYPGFLSSLQHFLKRTTGRKQAASAVIPITTLRHLYFHHAISSHNLPVSYKSCLHLQYKLLANADWKLKRFAYQLWLLVCSRFSLGYILNNFIIFYLEKKEKRKKKSKFTPRWLHFMSLFQCVKLFL